jgi:DNA-3-methyladenine glycosylase
VRLKKLSRDFYLHPTLRIARELLGKYLCRRIGNRVLVGRIVEVEAYLGSKDPASHAYRGRTKRNDVMFWKGGHLYVYFTYGMHFCANVVSEAEGTGHAVLLRALEPVAEVNEMVRRRKKTKLRELCSGPARLCQAMGISREQNGTDLCGRTIWIATDAVSRKPPRISRSRRIGISNGKSHLWRFFVTDNEFVSRAKPS